MTTPYAFRNGSKRKAVAALKVKMLKHWKPWGPGCDACPMCQSKDISEIEGDIDGDVGGKSAKLKCNACGAEGSPLF